MYHVQNPDNPEAEAIFKKIYEAYDILSNDEKRALYDKSGRKGLEEVDTEVDMHMFQDMLFGGDSFKDCFTELSIVYINDPKFMSMTAEQQGEYVKTAHAQNKELLLAKLQEKLSGHWQGTFNISSIFIASSL